MTRTSVTCLTSRLRITSGVYLTGAFVGTTLLLVALHRGAVEPFAFILWLLYLGPLGVIVAVFAVASGLTLNTVGPEQTGLEILVVLIFTSAAALNVIALLRLRREDATAPQTTRSQHRLPTAVLFSSAGAAFVLLSFLAGFFFLVAYGVDVVTPDEIRIRLQAVATASWLIGLTTAIVGLTIWTRGTNRSRSTLRWAIADLAVMVAMIAAVLINSSIGTS